MNKMFNLTKLIACLVLTSSFVNASDTFAKLYLDNDIVSLIEHTNGGYIGSDFGQRYPALIRFDDRGNAFDGWEYAIKGNAHFNRLIKTSDGGQIAIGNCTNGSLGRGPIVVKIDINGMPQWQIIVPRKSFYKLNWIEQTEDDGFIAAGHTQLSSTNSEAWIIKLTSNGHVSWSKTFGGLGDDDLNFVKQTTDQGFLVAGTFSDTINRQAIIAKFDARANLIWHQLYSSPGKINFNTASAALTAGNGLVLTGSFGDGSSTLMRVGSNGGIVWAKAFSSKPHSLETFSVIKAKDGGFVTAGSSDFIRGFDNRGLLLKVNSQGKLLWARISDSNLLSPNESPDSGFSLIGSGNNFNGILKTNSNGFIPKCSLIRKLSIKVKSPKITVSTNQNIQAKSLVIQAKTFSIDLRKIPVIEGVNACN
jgi:hypothetical protein